MKVFRPEAKPDLATDSRPQDLAHRVLGGELHGEGFLQHVCTHEDEHLLGGIGETDGGVVLQGDGGAPPHLDSVHPGP